MNSLEKISKNVDLNDMSKWRNIELDSDSDRFNIYDFNLQDMTKIILVEDIIKNEFFVYTFFDYEMDSFLITRQSLNECIDLNELHNLNN